MVSAPARRDVVRFIVSRGLSERRALHVIRMRASALRYQSAPDRNEVLRERIVALAHRHRRYGAGMIYLKLRQASEQVNHKRVEHLFAAARLQVKRCKRKKVPTPERKPLGRPCAANQIWSMDFVFDRTAHRRVIKSLNVVDDGAHEAVAILPERAIGGLFLRITWLYNVAYLVPFVRIMERNSVGAVSSTWRCTVCNRTWKTQPKRLHRIVQWALSR